MCLFRHCFYVQDYNAAVLKGKMNSVNKLCHYSIQGLSLLFIGLILQKMIHILHFFWPRVVAIYDKIKQLLIHLFLSCSFSSKLFSLLTKKEMKMTTWIVSWHNVFIKEFTILSYLTCLCMKKTSSKHLCLLHSSSSF